MLRGIISRGLPEGTEEYRQGPPALYLFLERRFESGICGKRQTLQNLSVFMHEI